MIAALIPLGIVVLIVLSMSKKAKASEKPSIEGKTRTSPREPAMISEEHVRRIGEGAYPETVRALAEKWGGVFRVSPSWVVSHAWVESTNHPRAYNPGGPAFGTMQMKIPTAENVVARLKKFLKTNQDFKRADEVRRVLKFWKGGGEDLFNPELSVMLGTYYLRLIMNKFDTDDQKIVAAAYNQGPGAVALAIKKGTLTPEMRKYLAKIDEAKEKGFA